MDQWTIVYTKNNNIFTKIKVWHQNVEFKSNTVPYPEWKYLSGSAFLVSLTASNKQSLTLKLVLKSRDQISNW